MSNDPLELFCLYYLGLTPQGEYRFANANRIAKHFNCTVDDLMGALRKHDLHPDTVLNTDFPLARHQVDIQIAAETETAATLKEFASRIYTDFRNKTGKARDWLAEIEREKQADSERRRN